MNPEAIRKVSEFSLQQARSYTNKGFYGRAFAHFLVYIELVPQQKVQVENEFSSVLNNWTLKLEFDSCYSDIFKCYQQALEHFPNNIEILINVGSCLLRLNQPYEAILYFDKVLLLEKNNIPAVKFLQSAKNALVERWHFRMLNDYNRNKAFKVAIEKAISNGYKSILDVGTGTGIFSVFAAKYKATSITACDASPTMISIAKNVLKANNVEYVRVLPLLSDNITIPSHLPHKVSLLCTEIFDSGVFGEHVLETLLYAWENLLLPYPEGKVIPESVDIFLAAVECKDLSILHRVCMENLGDLAIDTVTILSDRKEPYDTENLKDCCNVKYLTEPHLVWHVNFNDVHQLRKIIEGSILTIKLKVIADGNIDAFVGWFNLNIDSETKLNNAPSNPFESCWDHMICYVDNQLSTINREYVNIFLSCIDGAFKISCNEVVSEFNIFKVSLEAVKFLNDYKLMNCLTSISTELKNKFSNNISILDLSPIPIFGLLMLKQAGGKLTCKCKNEMERLIIKKICYMYCVDSTVIFITSVSDIQLFDFDIVMTNVLDVRGEISDTEMQETSIIKTVLKAESLLLPQDIYIWVQIISSQQLQNLCHVNDNNTCDCKVADEINYYQSQEHLNICLETLKYKELSKPVQFTKVKITGKNKKHTTIKSIYITCSGKGNAIIYWFDINFFNNISWSTNHKHSFISNAAFLLNPFKDLQKGQKIKLKMEQICGLVNLSVI